MLAQAGCYVPARALRIGVVDRLFSRVRGRSARGRSTFMAEMVETAAILTQATPRSLVILDDRPRHRHLCDGLAIAWACAEALHETNRRRGLFATHYHELCCAGCWRTGSPTSPNLSLKAKEWNGDLIFLHEAGPGPADRSYGVQVAKLEACRRRWWSAPARCWTGWSARPAPRPTWKDLPLFAAHVAEPETRFGPSEVEAELKTLDLDSMSPREAMAALYRLKDKPA